MISEKRLKIHYNRMVNKFEKNLEIDKLNDILFVGDSLTEWFMLKSFFDVPIINRGIVGDTTDGLLNRIDVSIIDLNPKIVVLLIGSNDITLYKSKNEIVDSIEKIVKIINTKLPNTTLYIQSLYPVNRNKNSKSIKNRTNEFIDEINNDLSKLEGNNKFHFIDVNIHLKDENNDLIKRFTFDGLHLNLRGYKTVSNIIKKCIGELQ